VSARGYPVEARSSGKKAEQKEGRRCRRFEHAGTLNCGGLKPSLSCSLENELHVIYSLRIRDIFHDILVGYVDGSCASINCRSLEAASEDESGIELRDTAARSVRDKTPDGG